LATFAEYFAKFAIPNRFDTKEVIFVKRMLQHVLPEDLRNSIADELFERYVGMNEEAFARELYMDKHQLEQLVNDGMHVGCHGYDHYWWDKLSRSALIQELERSKTFLAALGCDMNNWTACYPYGSSSDEVVAALEKQGCKLALTTEVRVADLAQDHLLLIPRLDTNDLPKQANAEPNHWYEKA
jgi:peptidoglycan/xylan/chitin deacetylase (PgdA/CDA1 family)